MSRSSTIWIVIDESHDVVAAFTVKHELVSFLGRQRTRDKFHLWSLYRVPDNPGIVARPPKEFEIAALLEDA